MDVPIQIRRRYIEIEKQFAFLQEWGVYINGSDSKEQYIRNVCIAMSNWFIMKCGCGTPIGYGTFADIFLEMYSDRMIHYWESNENI